MNIAEIVNGYYGLRELAGPEKNTPEIVRFFREIGHEWVKTDETAWCAAFVNYVLKKAGFPFTGKLYAKSFLAIGERISAPKPLGTSDKFIDIALFYRGDPWTNEDPEQYEPGHVAFYINARGKLIYVTGGNQSNQTKTSGYDYRELEHYRRIYKI